MPDQIISTPEIENTLEQARNLWNVPGTAVAIIHNDMEKSMVL